MREPRLFTDTSDFFAIESGDEILVGNRRYTVTGNERERRFGLDDPKFWVKRVKDSETGEKKIIKLPYLEQFEITLSGVSVSCFRNPDKEGHVLDLVKDHAHFMQGKTFYDDKNNNVRLLDIVSGPNLFTYIDGIRMGHAQYFNEKLPEILSSLVKALDAISFLHENGLKHGDIRNDHLYIERATGNYVWIDFDYDYEISENPFGLDLFGLGNILLYTIGKGFHNLYMIDRERDVYGDLLDRLTENDFSILDKWRLMNLRKIYPYIPRMLNDILMHFSKGTEIYYESVEEIKDSITWYLDSL